MDNKTYNIKILLDTGETYNFDKALFPITQKDGVIDDVKVKFCEGCRIVYNKNTENDNYDDILDPSPAYDSTFSFYEPKIKQIIISNKS